MTHHVSFSEQLDMSEYSDGNYEAKYQLRAVVKHTGRTMRRGHYIVDIYNGSRWYHVNDSTVTETSFAVVSQGSEAHAYVLVYDLLQS